MILQLLYKMVNRDSLICGVDLGSNRIKATAGLLDKKGNFYRLEYVDAKSYGMDAGLITDISRLTRILKRVINILEKKIGRKIKYIYININGNNLMFRNANAVMPLSDRGNKVVTLSDIKLVNSHARSLNIKLEEELIHDFPYRYILDDYNQVQNPKGLYGHKLASDLYLVVGSISHIENIIKLVHQSGLEIKDIVFSGLAASLAALDEKQREKGCVLIDIGADLTQVLIFKNRILRFADIITYGGNNITASISEVLKLPKELAEEIKDAYGSVVTSDIEANEEIMIKKENSYQPIKRRVISSIIEPEVTQLLTRIKEKIDLGAHLLGTDYSITTIGGSSRLDGLLELAESILGRSVRLGIPRVESKAMAMQFRGDKQQTDFSNGLRSLSNRAIPYTTSIGLIRYGFNLTQSNKLTIFRSKDTNLLTYLTTKTKDIYNEYF